MSSHHPILILADDLSGAAELAGIAFQHGLSAEVQRTFDPSTSADVIAIDTDSRNLSPADAAARVSAVATQARDLRPAWIYKKVDSILRGNVPAEIEALLDATGLSRALLIPANPSRGRTIVGGRYFIDGSPLDQTPLAADPNHPRCTADIRALLGSAGAYPIHCISTDSSIPATGIVVPDISSAEDLSRIVPIVTSSELLAGAADFFDELVAHRCQPARGRESISPIDSQSGHTPAEIDSRPLRVAAPAVLVCGSRVAWTTRHADCLAANIPKLTIDDNDVLQRVPPALLLGIGEQATGDQRDLLSRLALRAADLISETSANTLLVEGGATAAALAEHVGWTHFSVVATAPSGIGVLRPLHSPAPLVLVKPGSYPWPANIWHAFTDLMRSNGVPPHS